MPYVVDYVNVSIAGDTWYILLEFRNDHRRKRL